MKKWSVDIIGNRIILNPRGMRYGDQNALSMISSGRRSKKKGTISYPINWSICLDIRAAANKCGRDIKMGPALSEWAKGQRKRRDEIPDVRRMDAVPLSNLSIQNGILHDALATRPFQTVGAKFIATNRLVLLADQPGLGKTPQAIAGIVEAGTTGMVLVLAPRSAINVTWPSQIRRWCYGEKYGIIGAHLSPPERENAIRYARQWCEQNPDGRFWVFAGPNYVRVKPELDHKGNFSYVRGKKVMELVGATVQEFFNTKWSAIIVDESHQLLATPYSNPKYQSAQRIGVASLPLADDGIRLALSGTPFRGKPDYIWGTLNWLMPDLYKSYWNWAKKHFVTEEKEWYVKDGGGEKEKRTVITSKIIDRKAFYKELSRVMIRRTKAEVAKDLPPKQYAGEHLDPNDPNSPVAVWLDLTKEQRRAMKQLLDKSGVLKLGNEEILINHVFAEITRMKQISNSAGSISWTNIDGEERPTVSPILPSNKIEWIMDWLDDRDPDDPDDKIIIASQFTSFLELLSTVLASNNWKHHMLTGKTPDSARERAQMEFQGPGGPRIFLLNFRAGGTSLTLDAADNVIICDSTGDPDVQEQMEDRAHRVSRVHNVVIWLLASRGGIEEAIAAKQEDRDRTLKGVMDGTRGIEFTKELWSYMKESLH